MSTKTVEIISIGDELLIGQTVNTNATWLGAELTAIGFVISRVVTIADNAMEIKLSLNEARTRAGLVIVTGGLGPTVDDITKRALAEYFGTTLVRDEVVLARVSAFFEDRKLEMLEVNRQQADLPKDAVILENRRGTAMGMWFSDNDFVVLSLPGVPYEMKGILQDFGFAKMQETFKGPVVVHKTVHTIGLGESFLAQTIQTWQDALPKGNIALAYLPSPGIVKIRISAHGNSGDQLNRLLESKMQELEELIPDNIYGYGETSLQQEVGKMLQSKGLFIATAESCTGGYLAHLITSIAGSSAYYKGSVISYSNEVKTEKLGVSASDLETHGAVSQSVVEQMANGVKERYKTDYAIATSGIAGPDGGSPEKPVGTVWIAVAGPKKTVSKRFLFGRSRERNILLSAINGLNLVRLMLLEKI